MEMGPLRSFAHLAQVGNMTRAAADLLQIPIVAGATVSSCSATDARARELATRSRAAVETMEGAAVALACTAAGVPWVQLRCVSNRTGERSRAGWALDEAVSNVQRATGVLVEAWT